MDGASVQFGFWVLAAVVLIAGLLVVIVRQIRAALIAFGFCLVGVAGLTLLLDSLVIAIAVGALGAVTALLMLRYSELRHAQSGTESADLKQDKPLVPFVAAITLGVATALLIRKTYIDIWKYRLASEPIDSDTTAFWQELLTDSLPMLLVGLILIVLLVIVHLSLPGRDSAV